MNAHIRQRGIVSVQNNGNPAAMLADLTQAFNTFREKQNTRLDSVENAVDQVTATMNALRVGGGGGEDNPNDPNAARNEREAFGLYARRGDESGIKALGTPRNGMHSESDPDGGYVVTPQTSRTIQQRIFDVSPIARLARRITMGAGDVFEEPIDPSDIGAEWVGEREERPALTASKLKMLSIPLMEVYTLQPITQRLLDDSDINLGAWLEGKIADKFARTEGAAYVAGDGIKKPKGFLSYDMTTEKDGVRDWFKIQYVPTGAAAGFASSNPGDALIDLVYSLRAPYRPNARWLMNLATAGVIRKFKDGQGNYLWQNSAVAGQPATLLGFPVELDEEMPNIGANAIGVAFGDFQQAYTIIERPGLRALRDPYTSKPNVLFYTYRRVGGGLHNGEAVKVLKFAVS